MEHGGHHAMNHIWQRRWPLLAFARSGLHLRHTEGGERMLLLVTVLLMRREHGRHLMGNTICSFA